MQLVLAIDERLRILREIDDRLRARFGRPEPCLQLEPVRQLVLAMAGGRTRDAVSRRAYLTLMSRFGTCEGVRDAPVTEIHDAIKSVTFADIKAGRIRTALGIVTVTRGELTLDFLRSRTVGDALAWLERLPGVARKTAAATLNFSTLRMNALVIDTHHLRILKRLRIVDRRAGARDVYERVMPCLPEAWTADDLDDHHRLMKRLGQEICRHSEPACGGCPLNDLCPAAATRR